MGQGHPPFGRTMCGAIMLRPAMGDEVAGYETDHLYARVAQLIRVPRRHRGGRPFEPGREYQLTGPLCIDSARTPLKR